MKYLAANQCHCNLVKLWSSSSH